MSIKTKTLRNVFIYTVPKVAGYFISLITLPIILRKVAPADFGILALITPFAVILAGVFCLGLPIGVDRYYFAYNKTDDKINMLMFSTQIYFYAVLIVSSCVVLAAGSFLAKIFFNESRYGFIVFLLYVSVFINQIVNFYLKIFQNMEHAVTNAVFTMLQSIAGITLSIYFIYRFHVTYMGLIFGNICSGILVCGILIFVFNRQFRVKVFNFRILAESLIYGMQALPKSFTGFINRFFDKYMLNDMISVSAVGIYGIAQNISNAVLLLMNSVWSAFQPPCYNLAFENKDTASARIGRLFTVFSYLTIFPLLMVILFAQEIVYLLAPSSYYPAIDVIIILLAGISTQVFGIYVGVQYAYSKKVYLIFPLTVLGTIINVAVNILLIPKYGIIGAGIATGASLAMLNGLFIIVGQRIYRIMYEWKFLFNIFCIVFLGAFAAIYLRSRPFNIFQAYSVKLIFVLLYIFIGVHSKIITRNFFGRLHSVFSRDPLNSQEA